MHNCINVHNISSCPSVFQDIGHLPPTPKILNFETLPEIVVDNASAAHYAFPARWVIITIIVIFTIIGTS